MHTPFKLSCLLVGTALIASACTLSPQTPPATNNPPSVNVDVHLPRAESAPNPSVPSATRKSSLRASTRSGASSDPVPVTTASPGIQPSGQTSSAAPSPTTSSPSACSTTTTFPHPPTITPEASPDSGSVSHPPLISPGQPTTSTHGPWSARQ